MSEHAYRFGRADHLVGITGLPVVAAQDIGVIVLNAGMTHRIGPFRLHVTLCRRFNECGYPTLRFDLSTLGDSGASDESQSHDQQVLADVSNAMDLLGKQSGCTRFVLIGLCSGAANAHLVASNDNRVVGAVFLDGYAYPTVGYYLHHYIPRLKSPARLIGFITRRLRRPTGGRAADFGVTPPAATQARRDITSMLQRGLKLCFIYTGGASAYFNHARQFRECFGSRISQDAGSSLYYLPRIDHTYILVEDRQQLLKIVQGWLSLNFPAAAAEQPS